ncbi:MAG: hypothetical protein HKN29_05100, partial [Rhodothermales bacterium]|nr:hypothetical protein [Rhodothermales bacterium]
MIRRSRLLAGLLLLLSGSLVPAAHAQPDLSPSSVALSGAGVGRLIAMSPSNPASRRESRLSMGIAREYGVPELTTSSVGARLASAGAGLRYLGFDGYREWTLQLDGSSAFRSWRLGARLNASHVAPSGFSSLTTFSPELGFVRGHSLGSWGARISASEMTVGAAFHAVRWTVLADLSASKGHLAPRGGIEYAAANGVRVLASLALRPALIGLGTVARVG